MVTKSFFCRRTSILAGLLIAIALGGCARTPEQIDAHDHAVRAGAEVFPLTPAIRAGIAATVAKTVRESLILRWRPYTSATISQVKAPFNASGPNAPYYCVALEKHALLTPTMYDRFKVTPNAPGGDVLTFHAWHNGSLNGVDSTWGCDSNDAQMPFPEVMDALHANGGARPARLVPAAPEAGLTAAPPPGPSTPAGPGKRMRL